MDAWQHTAQTGIVLVATGLLWVGWWWVDRRERRRHEQTTWETYGDPGGHVRPVEGPTRLYGRRLDG